MNDEFDQDPAGKQQESGPEQGRETVYFYKDAGIQEHHGYIPFWLKAVALILVIWSVYYMIAYWSPPPE